MTATTPTVRPLGVAEVGWLRGHLIRDLAHAQGRQRTAPRDQWLYWSARVDALDGALRALDALCGSELDPRTSPGGPVPATG